MAFFLASLFIGAFASQARGACDANEYGEILCTETDLDGVETGDGDDAITVQTGAVVSTTAQQTAAALATAQTATVDSGDGNNLVTNGGGIGATATATAQAQEDVASQATAAATGIHTGVGEDTVVNAGSLQAAATATAVSGDILFHAAGSTSVAAGTEATATAQGIRDDGGRYSLLNSQQLSVTAEATAAGGDVEFQLIDKASADAGVTASASALGFLGQDANGAVPAWLNSFTNTGTFSVTATARAGNDELRFNLMDWAVADTSASAEATAVGFKAGAGGNSILNEGSLAAAAIAGSEVWKAEINISDWGLGASGLTVEASATALEGNSGADTVVNTGTLSATATADALKVDINGTLVDLTIGPGFWETLLFTSAGSADTLATAGTTGVNLLDGDDSFANSGSILVQATAELDKTAVAVGAEGIPKSIIDVLQGKALSSADPIAAASATGILAGAGGDQITNTGLLRVEGTAGAGDVSVNLSLPILEPIMPFPSPSFALGGSGVTAEAEAMGIDGEAGDDVIRLTGGQVDVDATATTTGVIVSGALQGVFSSVSLFDLQASVADMATTSEATANGLVGGAGDDTVHVAAPARLAVDGTASAASVDVAIAVQGKVDGALNASAVLARADTQAEAEAIGIDGGAGDDSVNHFGIATVAATADATSVTVGADVQLAVKHALSAGAAIASVRTEATATAAGMEGGSGDDVLANVSSFGTTASADADSVSVEVVVQKVEESLAVGLSYVDAETQATATAAGLDGGEGEDTLINATSGTLTTSASSDSTTVGVALTVSGSFSQEWSLVAGGAVTDGTTGATAGATGMGGDAGDDTLFNAGAVTTSALANADSTSVSVDVTGVSDGLTLGVTYADNATTATATASGLDGGDGDDYLTNTATGVINVAGTPEATSASVSATITGATKGTGITGGAALTDGATAATATSTGMAGGAGADHIHNFGRINVGATPDADAASVAVTLGGAGGELGLVGGFSYADSANTATATAVGIDGGSGDDDITSAGEVTVAALPTASSASVGVTAEGVKGMGAAVGVALADGTTRTVGSATGIAAGAGDDSVVNLARLSVEARPDTSSASVTVGIAAAKEGVAVAGSFADATTSSQATGTGIDGGIGDDSLTNAATIEVTAEAQSSSASVGVTAAGTMTGVAAGVSLSDATTSATATTAGITGGAGADSLNNSASVTTTALADIAGASVTVNLGAAETGLVAGVAAADASITASATTTGMDGGADADSLDNFGSLTTTATAELAAATVSVNAGFAVSGLAAGAALADGETVATAAAAGIAGADGDDVLTNRGSNSVTANATVTAASVGVNLEGTTAGLAAGASLVDGENRASATAVGLDGGAGDDILSNHQLTHASAVTDSTRASMSVSGTFALEGVAAGASFADASNTAGAIATGQAGGAGADRLYNNAGLRADATTTATTTSVSVGVNISGSGVSAGASFASADTTGTASALGMAGDVGDDWLENQSSGLISGKAETTAKGTVVAVNISAASFSSADLATTARADHAGLAGGAGADTLINRGGIDIDALSHGLGQSAAANLEGYGGADVSITSTAVATGLDGGADADLLYNFASIAPTATATATGRSVSANLLGAVFADAGITARATATGMSGGAGDDQASNSGTITLTGLADVDMTSVSVTLGGYSDADGSVRSELLLTGMDGGAGDDLLINEVAGRIVTPRPSLSTPAALVPTAMAETVTVGVNLLGAVNADGSSTTTANVFGLAGGGGADSLINRGTVDIGAASVNLGQSGSGTLAGYGEADVSVTATADATGLSGGDGADDLFNDGTIEAGATATAKGVSVTANLAGAGFAAANTTAVAVATGLAGGAGGDRLENRGSIQLSTQTKVDQQSVSVSLLGYADGAGESRATATLTGLDGGDGDDLLLNGADGRIIIADVGSGTASRIASARGVAGAVAVNLVGATSASGETAATANAFGLAGDAGNDTVQNAGVIAIDISTDIDASSTSVQLAGSGNSRAGGASAALAVGLDGGAGNDSVTNLAGATLMVSAAATGRAVGYDIQLAGGGSATAGSEASATAIGLRGGDGADSLGNSGTVTLTAASTLNASSSSKKFAGAGSANTSSTALAAIVGLEGGEEDNLLVNTGAINGTATATAYASSYSVELAGGVSASSGTVATAEAAGLRSGSGADSLYNSGSIDLTAAAVLDSSSQSYTVFGSSGGQTESTASATILGLDAGAGANLITNDTSALLKVKATATPKSVDGVGVFGGVARANSDVTAVVSATGIASGNDGDVIANAGIVDVAAQASGQVRSTAMVNIGNPSANASETATAAALGIHSGSGDDVVVNSHSIIVDAVAESCPASFADSDIAETYATTTASSTATASGIRTGDGHARVNNSAAGTIAVAAKARSVDGLNNIATASSDENATVTALLEATASGILTGQGDHSIFTEGQITVASEVDARTRAIASSLQLDLSATATTNSAGAASATGIEAGDGNLTIRNGGSISIAAAVAAEALSDYGNSPHLDRAYAYAGLGDATHTSTLAATAAGIKAGHGRNAIENDAAITVDATVNAVALAKSNTATTTTYSYAYAGGEATATGIEVGDDQNAVNNAAGGTITVTVQASSGSADGTVISGAYADENATTTADLTATATGIRAGQGDDAIINNGDLSVTSEVDARAYAVASTATTRIATATTNAGGSSRGTGIEGGDGSNAIHSNGNLTVTATTTGKAWSNYPPSVDHLDQAVAYAGMGDGSQPSTLTATATGIQTAGGADQIDVDRLTVTSTVSAEALAYSNTDSYDNTSRAYAGGDARAEGIKAGDGDNRIRLVSALTVTATATAAAVGGGEDYGYAYVGNPGASGAVAEAVGVAAGDGNNSITNDGRLEVNATATASVATSGEDGQGSHAFTHAAATAIRTGDGSNTIVNRGVIEVTAKDATFGIVTGAGTDTIIHSGTLATGDAPGSFSGTGIAITTGAGADQVLLDDGSVTVGMVDLGADDDQLWFTGTPQVTGVVTGAAGTDTLVFDGAGGIAFTPAEFEQARKQGAGTFVLASLPTMKNLTVDEGTLRIESSYAMDDDSTFRTVINGDGSSGRLSVAGTVGLDGVLQVSKGTGFFFDGTNYDIITAASVDGAFADITLPDTNSLVSFTLEQTLDAVRIETRAESFTTVATNPVARSVADYLDRIQSVASGDLLTVLAEVQNLSPGSFEQAFSSLSPDSYNNYSMTSFTIARQFLHSYRQRMNTIRVFSLGGEVPDHDKPILLAYSGTDLGQFAPSIQKPKKYGFWFKGLWQEGDREDEDGTTGSDFRIRGAALGFDRIFGDHLLVGAGFGYSRADIDLNHDAGSGDIDTWLGSLYGSWFMDNFYLDGTVSFGDNRYDSRRHIVVGTLEGEAVSDHDGDIFSACLGAGYIFDFGKWSVGPMASLEYAALSEDGFTEAGGGGVGLRVEGRDTEALISEAGLRVRREFEMGAGFLSTLEMSGAWRHDFSIDDGVITSAFAGSPGLTFAIPGQDVDADGLLLGTALTLLNKKGFSLTVDYQGDFRSDYESHALAAELRLVF